MGFFFQARRYKSETRKHGDIKGFDSGLDIKNLITIRLTASWLHGVSIYFGHKQYKHNWGVEYLSIFLHKNYRDKTEYYVFQSELYMKVMSFFKWIKNYSKIKELNREYESLSEVADAVCSDPMNGCPGDFAEDFDRQLNRISNQINELSYYSRG